MTSLKSIIRADYLQRSRSYAFLVTLLASVCMAYTFVPAAGTSYSTLRIGNYVGENNAAWIGHNTAIMASVFLWLIGFYLVNDGIKKDKETGVGQIIATTSISNFKYLLAKALSNFFVLLTIAIIIMLMAFSLVIIRGRNYPFNFSQFLLPYLFATIPTTFIVSVVAVFAEVVLGKYIMLQNIAFFFLFPVLIGIQSLDKHLFWLDVLGTKYLSDEMITVVNTHFNESIKTVSSGFLFSDKNINQYFLFEGTHWSVVYILSRILWIGIAFLLLFIFSRLFNRFDVKEIVAVKKKKMTALESESKHPLKDIQLSQLPIASPAFGIGPFVKTELIMLFRIGHKWFWLINVGGLIALLFIPLTVAHQIALPVIWFLQTNRWADIATKEKYNRTHYFTYAAYKPLQRLLTSQIIANVLLAITLATPLIFRYSITGNYLTAFKIILGAIFVVAFSVCSGVISGGKRFFEITFFILTYCNINRIQGLDYFGGFNHGFFYSLLLVATNCILFFCAFLFRGYEIRNQ